ncbi:TLC domain-containing protein [Aphelenchoides besseyi]|nr:TLC domain-containing protein [Aphelenchoides besseyi]KAI6208565.1 TLC domain-containing protein [Aphelenchoides besseyi]
MTNSSIYDRFSQLPNFRDINTYNWTLSDWEGRGKTTLAVSGSFVFWFLLQYIVRWYLFGRWSFRTFDYFKFGRSRRGRTAPPSTELEVVPKNRKWRISNEVVSLIHSVVSGLWALYAILTYPRLMDDMNTFSHPMPKILIYVSFGYIIHDLIDLLLNERSARILELLFHHVVVIVGFLTTLVTNLFLGVVQLGLLMEINSIFLHSRSLMNLYRVDKQSTAFRFIKLLNILTFLIFRIAVCTYLLYWQINNLMKIYWYHAIITFAVILSLSITNSVLLYRVLAADGILGASRSARQPIETKNQDDDDDEELDDDNDEDGGLPVIRNSRLSAAETQTNEKLVLNPSAVVVEGTANQ